MDENPDGVVISQRKLEANRRNAQRSTGPRTEEGKSQSRRNALKHGILISAVLITKGSGAEDCAEFEQLLDSLHRDLAPVGALEEILVEKIAVCWWRQKRALQCEAGLVRKRFAAEVKDVARREMVFADVTESEALPDNEEEFDDDGERSEIKRALEDLDPVMDNLRLPRGAELDRILRYETTVQRQLAYAIDQLERLQRSRKGEHVPAPVSVQVSSDK
jgi:hypothetical protein